MGWLTAKRRMCGMNLDRIIYAETVTGTKKYIVRLTEEERAEVERLTTTGRTAARTLRHAWVLLKAEAAPDGPGWTDEQIRDAYGVSVNTIGRIRQAFVEEGLEAALRGRPGQARWTVRLLADRFVELAGGVAVSRETVRRTLKKKRAQAMAPGGMVHPPGAER